ncbi:GNAT family N-acetyltransferase [Roseovarius salincola]|nr:GNAT family N-acetyltransferase [Roseovarius sp. EGI FJ00037]
MTPAVMAALHGRAFLGQGRGWSEAEFADLLDSPHVFAVGDSRAFALGRVIADEAELLTLATAPESLRQGLGRAALVAYETQAMARGAQTSFLEVAADNNAARALYEMAGYHEAARRTGYYRRDANAVDALILRRCLVATPQQARKSKR